MTRTWTLALLVAFMAAALSAQWLPVVPGVDYQEFRDKTTGLDAWVARIDLTNDDIAVISSREFDRGTKVTDFAKKIDALVAINGDYFDEKFSPVGLTIGPCGPWQVRAVSPRKESVVEIGEGRAVIARPAELGEEGKPAEWAASVLSGWPVLVESCTPLTAAQLPGSDAFTRSPQPRTAVGLSKDGETMYFVVADGRRTGVPGLTLAQLASFMSDGLHACSAVNLDGGGSAAMAVSGKLVNRPSDGVERRVSNHLAVVMSKNMPSCQAPPIQTPATEAGESRQQHRVPDEPPAGTSTGAAPPPSSTTAPASTTAPPTFPAGPPPPPTSPTIPPSTTTIPPPSHPRGV